MTGKDRTVEFRLSASLLDEIDARIEASPQYDNRSQFIRYSVRRALAEPGPVDVTAGAPR